MLYAFRNIVPCLRGHICVLLWSQRRKLRHSKLKRSKSKKYINKPVEEVSRFIQWILKIVMGLGFATTQTLKLVNNILHQKLLWTVLFIILTKSMDSQEASINSAIRLQEGDNQLDLLQFLYEVNKGLV